MRRLVSLEDPRARDEGTAGAKAAGLARARAAGLPVLPGWVLPSGEAGDAAAAGSAALARSGPAAACLAVAGLRLDADLLAELARATDELGGSVIVRSSTSFDDDARWSGAFATYHEVTEKDLAAAVLGCWASAFTRDVVARADRMGTLPESAGIAVLVQPWVAFETGGTASRRPDGSTVVALAPCGPAGLAGGGASGGRLEVSADGVVAGVADAGRAEMAVRVAALAAAVARETGHQTIEWGAAADGPVVLQTRPAGIEAARSARRPSAGVPDAAAETLARAASRFPAPLGEAFVLAWSGSSEIPVVPAIEVDDPRAVHAELLELARRLTAQAWSFSGAPIEPRAAARRAADAVRSVLGDGTGRGLEQLASLRPVDRADARRLLGLLGGMADAFVRDGRLPHRDLIWRISPEELDRAVWSDVPPPIRLGPDRWEPFVRRVIEGAGREVRGSAASPGGGAGRLVVGRAGSPSWVPRRVLALTDPVPHAAPLLWGAAGVVSVRGGLGAHLFEVARSLGVPAVAGVDLTGVAPGTLVTVDGDEGSVWVWDEATPVRRGASA